ncbi:hypothetical protein TWF694_003897 [Orbilia ellipsospora]|uniref:Uncharacterized protein n=1 Tax=Orbilia ellipsospora TaxID=2528407 RepID=A0AAV9WWA1_9PEZI
MMKRGLGILSPYRMRVLPSSSLAVWNRNNTMSCGRYYTSDFTSGFTSTVNIKGPVQGPLGKAGVLGKGITPRSLKRYLDSYVISQSRAKRVISAAVYNHYLRVQSIRRREDEKAELLRIAREKFAHPLEDEYPGQELLSPTNLESLKQDHTQEDVDFSIEIQKSNCLLLGPSGTGKTLIAKTLAKILDVPFSISDCTSFTQAGYVGEDVDVCVQRLLASCNWDTRRAETGIICLDEVDKISSTKTTSHGRDVSGEGVQQALLKILEGTTLQITNPKSRPSSPQVSGAPSGVSQSGGVTSSFQNFGSFGPAYPGNSSSTKGEIHTIDTSNILFILCGAFNGINKIILDRISKHSIGFNAPVRTRLSNPNAISFEGIGGVQNFYNARVHSGWREHANDVDQKSLATGSKQRTVNILDFTEPKDLISFGFLPEFVGRLPVVAALDTFDEETLVRVLSEPRNSLLRQYEQLFNMSGVELRFTPMALRQIAKLAIAMDTGARALRSVLEKLLSDAMFEAPGSSIKYILINLAAAKFEQPPLYFSRGQRDRFQGAFAAEDTIELNHSVQPNQSKNLSNECETYQPVAAEAT